MTAYELARRLLDGPDIEVGYWVGDAHLPVQVARIARYNDIESEVEIIELADYKD